MLLGTILNRSFIMGILVGTAVFSKYIFSNDNLYEEVVEKIVFNDKIDLSPESPDEKTKVESQALSYPDFKKIRNP